MNNFKFITRVVMPCTRLQFIEFLEKPLSLLGYDVDSYTSPSCDEDLHLVSSYANIKNVVKLSLKRNLSSLNTMIPFNPELFLALAAMTDAEYGIAGEWWICIIDSTQFTCGKLYKSVSSLNTSHALIDNRGMVNGYYPHNLKYFRKATKEEIISHFENTLNVKKVEEPDYSKGYIVKVETIDQVNVVSSHIKGKKTTWNNKFNYVIFEPENSGSTLYYVIPNCCSHYPLLTFTEFQEKILKPSQFNQSNQNQEKMEKKIIKRKVPCDFKYWGLKKDQEISVDPGKYTPNKSGYQYYNATIPTEIFESWEPVYQTEPKVFKMGIDGVNWFNLTVKEGKCFHKSEDISKFVMGLTDFYNQVPHEFEGYGARMSNVTFIVTGCEDVETHLSEWNEVRNEMERTK